MNYGGNNDVITQCPSCQKSCDTHKPFPFISSDDFTADLAGKLQTALDDSVIRGLLKGFDKSRTSCMVGAARATINSGVYTYVTISGGNLEPLQHIASLGKDVQVVTDVSALPLQSIAGVRLNPNPAPNNRNRDYPVGSCAAQKLLMAIFRDADAHGGRSKITKINLAEILWSDPSNSGHNRDWSTGQLVCSCDTCKRVVPMMLCHQEA
jgi:hypothetical protein